MASYCNWPPSRFSRFCGVTAQSAFCTPCRPGQHAPRSDEHTSEVSCPRSPHAFSAKKKGFPCTSPINYPPDEFFSPPRGTPGSATQILARFICLYHFRDMSCCRSFYVGVCFFRLLGGPLGLPETGRFPVVLLRIRICPSLPIGFSFFLSEFYFSRSPSQNMSGISTV